MKIDRQLGIITILLQCGKMTAPELARRFEVSRRTILRDIDDICSAGIPVVSMQGAGGGLSIAEGYKLDRSVLTSEELDSIIAGLGGIGSVSDPARVRRLIDKLAPVRQDAVPLREKIHIDLSSHYGSTLSEKISLIKKAIATSKLISFDYYSPKGVETRTIEPGFITFRWAAWYVFGYCCSRDDFRLFKLNRLWKLSVTDETFTPREIPPDSLKPEEYYTGTNMVRIVFDKSVEYLLAEEYGPDGYTRRDDGSLLLEVSYTSRDYIIKWILGFGEHAVVLEPAELADAIKTIAEKTAHNYSRNEHDKQMSC